MNGDYVLAYQLLIYTANFFVFNIFFNIFRLGSGSIITLLLYTCVFTDELQVKILPVLDLYVSDIITMISCRTFQQLLSTPYRIIKLNKNYISEFVYIHLKTTTND